MRTTVTEKKDVRILLVHKCGTTCGQPVPYRKLSDLTDTVLRMATEVVVRRSARRRRTVSAHREGDRVVVLIPAWFSAADEQKWVATMVRRLERRSSRPGGDLALSRRAAELSTTYLAGRARPTSVRWVGEMRTRWASCTPTEGTIRMSRRLQTMPSWVRDYVLVHELAHLLVPGHGPNFWALVGRYPRAERARGYLDGVSAAASLGMSTDLTDDLADDVDDSLPPDSATDLTA